MSLADDDAPLVLADGTQIDPRTSRPVKPVIKYVEVPTNKEAVDKVVSVRRTLADLPAPPKQMNVVSLVVTYVLYGLNDTDIGIALGMSDEQVKNVKGLAAYKDVLDKVTESIVSKDTDDVRRLIETQATTAAKKVIETMNSEDELLGFKAAQDVLDRAGHRPVDVVEHKHTLSGGLVIEYVDNRGLHALPTIDVDYKEVNDGSSNG